MNDRTRQIRTASLIGIFGNFFLAVLKITAGFVSGSLAVIGDGIDTTTDVVTSFVTLFTARIIAKPPDQEHPYGHGRAETIATKVLSFIIFFAGAQLAWSTILRLISGETFDKPSIIAVWVTIGSIAGKILLAFSQMHFGRRIGSSMLIANGRNMQNDILISSGVLAGLVFTFILRMPVLDALTALIVSVWIMKTGLGIFMETYTELMDGNLDSTIYPAIFEAVGSVDGALNPHRTRVRRIANMYIIDLDIEVDGALTVEQGHRLAIRVEKRVRRCVDNVYDIMVHVEPIGNVEQDERYGLSEESRTTESDR